MNKTIPALLLAFFCLSAGLRAEISVLHDKLLDSPQLSKPCYVELIDFNTIRLWGPIDRDYKNTDFIREYYDKSRNRLRSQNLFSSVRLGRNLLYRCYQYDAFRPGEAWDMDLLLRISLSSNWSVLSLLALRLTQGGAFHGTADPGGRSASCHPASGSENILWRSIQSRDDYSRSGRSLLDWIPLQVEYLSKTLFFHYEMRISGTRPLSLENRILVLAAPAWSPCRLGFNLNWKMGR